MSSCQMWIFSNVFTTYVGSFEWGLEDGDASGRQVHFEGWSGLIKSVIPEYFLRIVADDNSFTLNCCLLPDGGGVGILCATYLHVRGKTTLNEVTNFASEIRIHIN